MELIHKYFPNLTDTQISQFEQLWDLYQDWNQKINVISRKDIDNLYVNHVVHSLTIAKYIKFKPDTKVMDLGTGGGFPAIPLAIFFPDVKFTAIDGTKKKILVVNEVKRALELDNLTALHQRAEEHKVKYEFVVTRAVAKIDKLKEWSFRLIDHNKQRHTIPNGIIALKGGSVKEEKKTLHKNDYIEVQPLTQLMYEPEYEEKFILYLQR